MAIARRYGMAALLGALLASFPAAAQQATGFTIATGAKDGNPYSVGGSLCRLVNGGGERRCAIRESGGSIENFYALNLGEVDFAILRADVQKAAFEGDMAIEGTPEPALRSVFSIHPEMLAVIVPDASPVMAFEDLAGATVGTGSAGSGTVHVLRALLAAAEMEPDAIVLHEGDVGQEAEALCAGGLDALLMMTGHPSAALNRLSETCAIRLVPVAAATLDAAARANDAYRAIAIPAESYDALEDDVATLGTYATLVTMAETPDTSVVAILAAVFADYGAFRRQHLALGAPTPVDEALTAPLHEAADRFFRENGLMR